MFLDLWWSLNFFLFFSNIFVCLFWTSPIVPISRRIFLSCSWTLLLKLIIKSTRVLYCLSSVCKLCSPWLKLHLIVVPFFNDLNFFSGCILKSKYSRFLRESILSYWNFYLWYFFIILKSIFAISYVFF